jgi:hypothetical protein
VIRLDAHGGPLDLATALALPCPPDQRPPDPPTGPWNRRPPGTTAGTTRTPYPTEAKVTTDATGPTAQPTTSVNNPD